MKNIHLIPIDKSILNGSLNILKCINGFKLDKQYNIGDIFNELASDFDFKFWQPQNIYITNSEEIKIGDYYINTFVSEREQKPQTHTEKRHLINHQKDYRFKYCKKIILTDNKDLIKDGVQAIDDEFLEWFVKNPSCEEVKVYYDLFEFKKDNSRKKYIIFIPKEEVLLQSSIDGEPIWGEPKQETTIEEAVGKKATDYCEKYKGTDKYNVAMLAIEFGYQLFETRHNYIKKHTYSEIEQKKCMPRKKLCL
jgi:hypothetical protein